MTGGWLVGTVVETRTETPSGRSLVIEVPDWPGNVAGQHVDVRLTAPDGYQATRSYSLASADDSTRVQLAVDRLPDGEVSPYLVDGVEVGDQLELRGPLGGWFVWRPTETRPVQLIAGGSGVVPLVAMLRARAAAGTAAPMRLLYSVRSPGDRFFADELEALDGIDYAYTRQAPDGFPRPPGRVTADDLARLTIPASENPAVFVCGPTGFVETVARALVDLGHDPLQVKTERFGGA
ncbi:MAG: ferredoxin reductase [Aeromicrobium sp.]